MKKIITSLIVVILLTAVFTACSTKNDKELLCGKVWISSVNVIEFMPEGIIRYNFEPVDTSTSYYKILSGNRINMYTEEGEAYGMIFDYKIEDDTLYLGKLKYTALDEKDEAENGVVESGPYTEENPENK